MKMASSCLVNTSRDFRWSLPVPDEIIIQCQFLSMDFPFTFIKKNENAATFAGLISHHHHHLLHHHQSQKQKGAESPPREIRMANHRRNHGVPQQRANGRAGGLHQGKDREVQIARVQNIHNRQPCGVPVWKRRPQVLVREREQASPAMVANLREKAPRKRPHQRHWRRSKACQKNAPLLCQPRRSHEALFMSLDDPEYITSLASLFNLFLKGVISIPLNIPGTRFYQAVRATEAVRKELLQLLHKRRLALENKTASPSQDLLSHLLTSPDENGKFMSETEVVNNILLMLFAGHDTSSVAIALTLKVLSEQPQVYDRVFKEQDEIAKSKKEGEFLQWEDIQKMKYSWNVVCEVMRLQPPIQGTYREALVDLDYGGYHIPKGWKLYWSPFSTQQDPDLFSDSMRFDPTRFEGSGPTPYSYVPFGGGPRMCIGKEYARVEILVFLHNLIKDFRWSLVVPDEKISYDPMPVPLQGLPIRLLPHDNVNQH